MKCFDSQEILAGSSVIETNKVVLSRSFKNLNESTKDVSSLTRWSMFFNAYWWCIFGWQKLQITLFLLSLDEFFALLLRVMTCKCLLLLKILSFLWFPWKSYDFIHLRVLGEFVEDRQYSRNEVRVFAAATMGLTLNLSRLECGNCMGDSFSTWKKGLKEVLQREEWSPDPGYWETTNTIFWVSNSTDEKLREEIGKN